METVGIIVRRFGAGAAPSFEGYEIATYSTALWAGFLAMTMSIKSSLTEYY
jgi:hypothetical protein